MQGRSALAGVMLVFTVASVSWLSARQAPALPAQTDWGAPAIDVSHEGRTWTIAGRKQRVTLNDTDLSTTIQAAGGVAWKMVPSGAHDLLVRVGHDESWLRLADAGSIKIVPYRTGFKSGVKITLGDFHRGSPGASGAGTSGAGTPSSPSASPSESGPLDLRLVLTMALEGGDEDLTYEVTAVEGAAATVRELHWPTAMEGRDVDATVLSNDDGMLLPRDWPKAYEPIHRAKDDTSVIQSDLIESWSMSWWGFQKGPAAMIVIVETPDDAAYTFAHPAGGPTAIGPSWRAQLGRFSYLRSLRMAFLPKGNYVDLAKRYRRYVMDTGLFVSLKEKIARSQPVANLIGTPMVGTRVLRNVKKEGPRYDTKDPSKNYSLTTFADQVKRLRSLKAAGFDRLNVSLSGWPNQGYDRQHPDGLPPTPEGGGWEGMKAFFDACGELHFTCWLHDQYRDYYPDAPSYNTDFAVREEDATRQSTHFPGTRFHPHDWKEGDIPMMNYWDGGTQAYLNNRYMLGHVEKNYRLMAEHGIRPQGSYNDVFGYIPPDQDFNPEHPSTRTESMKYRAEVCSWVRRHLGIVGTEDGADWMMPYVDYVTSRDNRNPGSGNDDTGVGAIEVPLYELVYHDAIVTTYSPGKPRGFLHASAPSMSSQPAAADLAKIRRLAALHARVGLQEMVNHEFLDPARHRERTTFADGTTVTVDWQTNEVSITPEVKTSDSGGTPGAAGAQQADARSVPCPKCQRIFDGQTWDGWEHDSDNWTIVDGAMRGFGKGARAAYTKADYGSFRLVVTSRMSPVNKDHLGILFWGPRPEHGSIAFTRNLQVQPPHGAMWDYFENVALKREEVVPGSRDYESWHTTEILANLPKGSLRVAVDGREISRYADKDPTRLTKGPIGMQKHGSGGSEYKDIFVEADPTDERLVTVTPP
jgi:hypothetical protein